jgi:RNA polymerase sigma-70 factor (ECF subfamily)
MRHILQMNNAADATIIDQVIAGHISLFAQLIDRYNAMAFTLAYRILDNREDAEEVVQDAFVKAYEHLGDFRQKSKFSTWLYRIVYNTAISHARIRRPCQQEIDERAFQVPDNGPSEDTVYGFTQDEAGELVEKMLKILPEEDRIILTLYYLNESGIDEIHAITRLSKANIKVKLFRARKKIQDCITRVPDAVPFYSLNIP